MAGYRKSEIEDKFSPELILLILCWSITWTVDELNLKQCILYWLCLWCCYCESPGFKVYLQFIFLYLQFFDEVFTPFLSSFCFHVFVTLKYLRSLSNIKICSKIARVNTKCDFEVMIMISFIKGKKAIQTHLTLCEKVLVSLVKPCFNCD